MLKYELQFFAKEGEGGEKQKMPLRKNWKMPEKKDRLPKARISVSLRSY